MTLDKVLHQSQDRRLDLSLLLCGGRPPTLKFTLESDGREKRKKNKPMQKLLLLFFLCIHSAAPSQLAPTTCYCTKWRFCRKEGDAMQCMGCAEKENNLPSSYSSPPTLVPTSLTPLPLDFLFLFFTLRGNKEEKKKPLHFPRSLQFKKLFSLQDSDESNSLEIVEPCVTGRGVKYRHVSLQQTFIE